MENNILFTLKNNLCTGCGICEDICPTHSITIKRKQGEYRPVLNKNKCLGNKCGRCLKVCPGAEIDIPSLTQELFPTIKQDKYIGRYYSTYTGYSKDKDIRLHGASGGLVSQFLIFLLEKKIIDGAVVTGFSEDDHITPQSYIARTKEEILKARSSKYCPVALNKIGNEIKESKGNFVIVGLPCHIQGFRKRAIIDKKFREHVIGYFSIYCSSNRTFNAQDYLLKKYKVNKNDIQYFAFRDNGCLGNLTIKQNKEIQLSKISDCFTQSQISIPYSQYYHALRSYFKPKRCLQCIDHYGALADVCFGDIHIKPYSEDTVGISSWIVRNKYWDDLFKQMENENFISMKVLNVNTLNESQKVMLYPKIRRAKAEMYFQKLCGKQVVDYKGMLDNIQPKWNDFLHELLTNGQRFIGKRHYLWSIINLIK